MKSNRFLRTEYVYGLVLFCLTLSYGFFAKTDISTILGLIISSMFVSKGLTDFKKNNKED